MNKNNIVIELQGISKSFTLKNERIDVLKNASMKFEKGKFYAIIGHSGCGKSTLINILGLTAKIDNGNYWLHQIDVSKMKENELSQIRLKNIGFVFQDYNLDPYLKAYENVMLPMVINKSIASKDKKTRAIELLETVGLEKRINHFPKELSGGEQQRVAIARALANNPNIILADEPTGNLDKKNEDLIFKRMKKLSTEGKCVIVVSHSLEIEKYADFILEIENGLLRLKK